MNILNSINSSLDIKRLSEEELTELAAELRCFLVESVSKTGGHLASNLGAVELTLALHRVYNTEKDRIVFDVGHQSYAHKIITGRRDRFDADSAGKSREIQNGEPADLSLRRQHGYCDGGVPDFRTVRGLRSGSFSGDEKAWGDRPGFPTRAACSGTRREKTGASGERNRQVRNGPASWNRGTGEKA